MGISCYHCSLPVPEKRDYLLRIEGKTEHFCCPGCLAVASTIAECGLDSFYALRDTAQNQVGWQSEKNPFVYLDHPEFQHESFSRQKDTSVLSISLVGLTCAACVWLIEKYLVSQLEVLKVDISQVSQRATIEFDEQITKASDVMAAISALGYQATLDRGVQRANLVKQEQKKSLMRLGVAAIGMMQVGMYAIALHAGAMQGIGEMERDLMRHAALIISTLVVFYSARPFFQAAWSALKHRSLVMDVPVSIAILTAYSASLWSTLNGHGEVYFDSVTMFTFFLLLSRFLESQARSKLDTQPVQSLIPDTALLSDRSGHQIDEVSTSQLCLGDQVLVQPGKAVPADLRVLSGRGEVDESILSGEFKPVSRGQGDELVAGSLNGEGRFIGEVIRLNQDSSLATVDRLYEQAVQKRSASEQLADRLAVWFIAFVLGAASITYIYWLNLEPTKAFWITLSVLVVSCPCALSLATPTSVTAAIFALRKVGILIRHSEVLDQLNRATDLVFDKTGTLTEGRAKIVSVEVFGRFSEEKCGAIAAALESYSSHPFAKAFSKYSMQETKVEEGEVHPGQGVLGSIVERDQKYLVKIGNADFVGVEQASYAQSKEDEVPIYLSIGQELLAIFYLEDPIRSSAYEAVADLVARGFELHLLSGDPSAQSQRVASQLGISKWHNKYSAEDKLSYIQKLQAQGRTVIFVGDGINDVPAMGGADISLVVAQATDLVQARASIGLVVTDLRLISQLLDQCVRLSRVLRQNISWAIVYNFSAIPAAAMGLVAPWLAAIGMSLSSVLVVLNALRLKKVRR